MTAEQRDPQQHEDARFDSYMSHFPGMTGAPPDHRADVLTGGIGDLDPGDASHVDGYVERRFGRSGSAGGPTMTSSEAHAAALAAIRSRGLARGR